MQETDDTREKETHPIPTWLLVVTLAMGIAFWMNGIRNFLVTATVYLYWRLPVPAIMGIALLLLVGPLGLLASKQPSRFLFRYVVTCAIIARAVLQFADAPIIRIVADIILVGTTSWIIGILSILLAAKRAPGSLPTGLLLGLVLDLSTRIEGYGADPSIYHSFFSTMHNIILLFAFGAAGLRIAFITYENGKRNLELEEESYPDPRYSFVLGMGLVFPLTSYLLYLGNVSEYAFASYIVMAGERYHNLGTLLGGMSVTEIILVLALILTMLIWFGQSGRKDFIFKDQKIFYVSLGISFILTVALLTAQTETFIRFLLYVLVVTVVWVLQIPALDINFSFDINKFGLGMLTSIGIYLVTMQISLLYGQQLAAIGFTAIWYFVLFGLRFHRKGDVNNENN